jgi:meiotic recombination protein SPO11
MSTYKHGSKSLAHETKLDVPSIQWLGVRSLDAMADNRDGLLPLTKRDRNIAKKMLEKQDIATRDREWGRELQLMLILNMKAEIQILGNEDQLGVWLDRKLSTAVDEVKVEVDADGDILML